MTKYHQCILARTPKRSPRVRPRTAARGWCNRAASMVCGVTLASDGENSGGSSGGGSGDDECTVTYSLANFSSA